MTQKEKSSIENNWDNLELHFVHILIRSTKIHFGLCIAKLIAYHNDTIQCTLMASFSASHGNVGLHVKSCPRVYKTLEKNVMLGIDSCALNFFSCIFRFSPPAI